MMKHNAIGYIYQDVSGSKQQWDEKQIRSLARRWGYNLMKTVVFNARTEGPAVRLRTVVERLGVEAVFVPNMEHLQHDEGALRDLCAVIDVKTEKCYSAAPSARRSER
jgi:hypothetical protein